MKNRMRTRAKAHMPMVLLTLLSIIQALALELTWHHVLDSAYLFQPTWVAVLMWTQIVTTLLGILLIWQLYSSMVMRFRWVPSTGDTVFPFVIGIVEFTMIASLGPETMGWWFTTLAVLFGITTWSIHLVMRQARLDGENEMFFATVPPATLRDFAPTFAVCASLVAIGVALHISEHRGIFAMVGLLAAAVALGRQMYSNAGFWHRSMAEVEEAEIEEAENEEPRP